MNGWTLVSLDLEWELGRLGIWIADEAAVPRRILAEEVVDLRVPRHLASGAPASIEKVQKFSDAQAQLETLRIEVSGGDVIEISARKFLLPAPAPA
jgi:hypothetical protein